jgi:hypothetical protein
MNKMHYMKLFFCSLFVVSTNARTLELNSRSRLAARINQSYLAAVQFYGCQTNCSNDCQKQDYKIMKSRFNAVSQNSRFRQAGIDFIIMNCSSDFSVAQDFGFSSLPAVMLFVNGMPVPGASLYGFVNEFDVNALIENSLGNEIDNVLYQKQQDYEQKQEMQLAAWAAWAPYWYGGYGCYRPCGFGMYGGFGRGCCW